MWSERRLQESRAMKNIPVSMDEDLANWPRARADKNVSR
jgi:hypothetical protein